MKLTRLSWAGLWVEHAKINVLIDPVEDFSSLEPYMGKPRKPIVAFKDAIAADLILLTHLHQDHYDLAAIRKCLKPGGLVVCHPAAAGRLQEDNLPVVAVELNQTFSFGLIQATPVFALDGIGHEQVSWVVQAGREWKILHAGDTIWHNRFWDIRKKFGPMDAVFLPINGVVVNYPFVGFHPLPASLTPEQAVVAARILEAGLLVPIHFHTFHAPPVYTEFPEVEKSLLAAAAHHQVKADLLPEGGTLNLPAAQ